MPSVPASIVAASGLIVGYAAARSSGRRELGGAVFAAAGAWSAREWARTSGAGPAIGLTVLYTAAMGGSHPLAKKVGAWTAVLALAAAVVAASELVSRGRLSS